MSLEESEVPGQLKAEKAEVWLLLPHEVMHGLWMAGSFQDGVNLKIFKR